MLSAVENEVATASFAKTYSLLEKNMRKNFLYSAVHWTVCEVNPIPDSVIGTFEVSTDFQIGGNDSSAHRSTDPHGQWMIQQELLKAKKYLNLTSRQSSHDWFDASPFFSKAKPLQPNSTSVEKFLLRRGWERERKG